MSLNLSSKIFDMAKEDYLDRVDLLKVIRKYHRSKDEAERDALRDTVVQSNMRLVIKISKVYAQKYHQNHDDLFQNGIIGVLVALDKFKPSKKFAFSTYAYYWIELFVQKGVASDESINTHRYLSVGAGKAQIYFKCFAESDGDIDKFGSLLIKRGISRKEQDKIERVIAMTQHTNFLDLYKSVGSEPGDQRLIDIIEDKKSKSPDLEAIDNIIREKIEDCMTNDLTEIERLVIRELYFSEKRNVNDASKKLKKSKPHIEKAEQRAIKKIAKAVKGEKLPVLDSFDRAWDQLVNGEYSKMIAKIIQDTNTDLKPVSELPLKTYICAVDKVGGKMYEVLAPTARAAVNFLREKTPHYFDIKIYYIDGQPFDGSTPSAFVRDFKREEWKRVKEEINASRWK